MLWCFFCAVSLIYLMWSLPHFQLDLLYLQVYFPNSFPLHYILQIALRKYFGILKVMKITQRFLKTVLLYFPQQEDYRIPRSWMSQERLFGDCLPPKHKQVNPCLSCMRHRRLLGKGVWETNSRMKHVLLEWKLQQTMRPTSVMTGLLRDHYYA